ncbi:hypothetical protein TNCV_3629931 [Trichonephila clavipes]|nr:hypothetical protein TNCV_3629931 [Trichonephila clavipes]
MNNARPHKAHQINEFLESEDICWMDWPVRSPDPIPIEFAWYALRKAIITRSSPLRTNEGLKTELLTHLSSNSKYNRRWSPDYSNSFRHPVLEASTLRKTVKAHSRVITSVRNRNGALNAWFYIGRSARHPSKDLDSVTETMILRRTMYKGLTERSLFRLETEVCVLTQFHKRAHGTVNSPLG